MYEASWLSLSNFTADVPPIQAPIETPPRLRHRRRVRFFKFAIPYHSQEYLLSLVYHEAECESPMFKNISTNLMNLNALYTRSVEVSSFI